MSFEKFRNKIRCSTCSEQPSSILCGRIGKHASQVLSGIFERAFRNFYRAVITYADLHRASAGKTGKPCCPFFCTKMVLWFRRANACIDRIPMRIKSRSVYALGTTAQHVPHHQNFSRGARHMANERLLEV
ncbi:hypothetical protein D6B98_39090 [Bradyrhizobium sp. LVM 105]|nr:hypothetical protein D6B98_39090 [Bradyrhizobium sp. LVM 105]